MGEQTSTVPMENGLTTSITMKVWFFSDLKVCSWRCYILLSAGRPVASETHCCLMLSAQGNSEKPTWWGKEGKRRGGLFGSSVGWVGQRGHGCQGEFLLLASLPCSDLGGHVSARCVPMKETKAAVFPSLWWLLHKDLATLPLPHPHKPLHFQALGLSPSAPLPSKAGEAWVCGGCPVSCWVSSLLSKH